MVSEIAFKVLRGYPLSISFRRFTSVSSLYSQIVLSDTNQRLEAAVRKYSSELMSHTQDKSHKYVIIISVF